MSRKEKTLADEAKEFQKKRPKTIPEEDLPLVLSILGPRMATTKGSNLEVLVTESYEVVKLIRKMEV